MADVIKPVNKEITFTGIVSDFPSTYFFNFGDGTPPVETASPEVKHTYTQKGVYTVLHKVANICGTSECSKTLEITAEPTPTGASGLWLLFGAIGAAALGAVIVTRDRN